MRDSDTYLANFGKGYEEGRLEQRKKIILQLGRKKLGNPAESDTATLATINDMEHLERILECLLDVKTWQELLATP